MTEQTKRALERLPKGPVTIAHCPSTPCGNALSELAVRSPRLLEMLDKLVHEIGWLPSTITGPESYSAAKELLRETTRAMLSEK